MENGPFENVFPIEHSHCYVSLSEGKHVLDIYILYTV